MRGSGVHSVTLEARSTPTSRLLIDHTDESETLFANVVLTSNGLAAVNKVPGLVDSKINCWRNDEGAIECDRQCGNYRNNSGLVRLVFDQIPA